MKKKNYIFILSLIFFIISSCTTLKVSYDYDRKADFSLYKTFVFDKEKLEKLQINDLDKRRIVEEITTNLKEKGFIESDQNADLSIIISNSTKDKLNTYYYDNWPMWGGWNWPWWGNSMGTRAYSYQYTEGTIIIDIVDSKKNLLLFQGRGSGIDTENLNLKKETIQKLIHKILANYPPLLIKEKKRKKR